VKKHTCCNTDIQALHGQKGTKLCTRALKIYFFTFHFITSHSCIHRNVSRVPNELSTWSLSTNGLKPVPSLPKTRIVGWPGKTSFRGTAFEETEPPRTRHPFSADDAKNCILFLQHLSSISSREPALALLTTPLNRAEFFAHSNTP